MRIFFFYIFITAIIILLHGKNIAYPVEKNTAEPEYQAQNIIGFTRHLVSKEEYYRAHVELLRCRSCYPDYLTPGSFYVSEIYILFRGKMYDEVIDLKTDSPDKDIRTIDAIFKADALLVKSDFARASDMIGPLPGAGHGGKIDIYLYKRMFLSHLLLGKIDESREMIESSARPENIDLKSFEEAIGYAGDSFNSRCSPSLAASLGIIPGLGYVYADQKGTGVLAFLVVSVFSTLTYYSFRTGNKPVGVVFGAAAAFFYAGNILGGYMASKKYNIRSAENLREYLFERMGFSEDRDEIFSGYGIGNGK